MTKHCMIVLPQALWDSCCNTGPGGLLPRHRRGGVGWWGEGRALWRSAGCHGTAAWCWGCTRQRSRNENPRDLRDLRVTWLLDQHEDWIHTASSRAGDSQHLCFILISVLLSSPLHFWRESPLYFFLLQIVVLVALKQYFWVHIWEGPHGTSDEMYTTSFYLFHVSIMLQLYGCR